MVMSLSRRALVGVLSLLVSAACLVVALPATPAAAATNAQLVATVVARINAIRAAHHLPALRREWAPTKVAISHNEQVTRYGRIVQLFPGELSVAAELPHFGYRPAAAAKTVGEARNDAGLVGLPNAMMHDSRRSYLLSNRWTDIGVDLRWLRQRHTYVATLVFSRQQPTLQQQAASSVLGQLNAERAAHRLPPLTMDSRLVASAHQHNLAMASRNLLSHQLPGEASLGPRILRAGYRYYYAGENVAWTTDRSVAGVVNVHVAMYDEVPPNDGHRLNILSPNYRNVGIDVVIDSAHGKAWITEDFGRLQ